MHDEDCMLGLWGTSDLKRIAVSLELDKPKTIIGYVREVDPLRWVAEGDPNHRQFEAPRQAADHGYTVVWRTTTVAN